MPAQLKLNLRPGVLAAGGTGRPFKPEARHGKIGRGPLSRVPTGMGARPESGLT